MKKKLLSLSAYYKNNKKRGLGFTVMAKNSSLNDQIEEWIKNYEGDWKTSNKEEQKKIVKTYFEQLEHFAKLRGTGREHKMKPQDQMLCIINIWFLENYGFLKSDEYNGCKFVYEPTN